VLTHSLARASAQHFRLAASAFHLVCRPLLSEGDRRLDSARGDGFPPRSARYWCCSYQNSRASWPGTHCTTTFPAPIPSSRADDLVRPRPLCAGSVGYTW